MRGSATCTRGTTQAAAVSIFLLPDQRSGLRRPPPVDFAPLPRRLHRPLLPLRPLRHGEMAGTLGGARLRRRLHRRLVRTSTFAGSSSPSPIGTPSPTSPTVVSPH